MDVLKKIFIPPVGSIWKIENYRWKTGFAKNKDLYGLHPAIVERIKNDKISIVIVPGTSKSYKKGSCVFNVDLSNNGIKSHFLLKLSMAVLIEDLLESKKGWNNIMELNQKQLSDFQWQIKICRG
jgi:hypothetical protein